MSKDNVLRRQLAVEMVNGLWLRGLLTDEQRRCAVDKIEIKYL